MWMNCAAKEGLAGRRHLEIARFHAMSCWNRAEPKCAEKTRRIDLSLMKTGDNRAAAEDGLPKGLATRARCGDPAERKRA